MSSGAIVLAPLAIKYIDMIVMAAIHKGFQDADGMTDEELEREIARLEERAADHDAWIEARLAAAKEVPE